MKTVSSAKANLRYVGPQWGVWLLAGLLVLLALATGLLAATGSVFVVIVPVLLLMSVVLAFYPWLFTWLIIFSGLAIMGTLQLYAPQFQIIRWVIPLLAWAVPLAVLLMQAFKRRPEEMSKLPTLFWWGIAFATAGLISTLLNWNGADAAFVGAKNYFQVWGLIVVFSVIHYRGDFTRGMTIFLGALGLIQLPLVLHQYFYIVPERIRIAVALIPEDAISGTFGAELYGGGNNALLAAYLFIVIGLLLSLWRQKTIPVWLVFPAIVMLAVPVFLNEAKIAFFYAWIIFVVLYWADIVRRPLSFLVANIFLILFLFVFVFFYAQLAVEAGKAYSVEHYLNILFEQNLYKGYGTYELNRWTALLFWYQEHLPNDLLHALVGHGLGETQESALLLDVSNTIGVRRYHGMGIGLTGLSALLWEVGLIGTTLATLIFLSAYRLAGRLARETIDRPIATALFKGLQAGVVLLALSVLHKNLIVLNLIFQTLFVMVMGYLIYSARFLPQTGK